MNDPRDFLTFSRLATMGTVLCVLGLLKSLTATSRSRLAVAGLITVTGVAITWAGGAAEHRRPVPLAVTALVLVASVGVAGRIVRFYRK